MKGKNFQLIKAMWERKTTQCEVVRDAQLSSEARYSRIINRLVSPTEAEVKSICKFLRKSARELGFVDSESEDQK